MATHEKDLKQGSKTYYISHSGETLYYSTVARGKGTSSIRGVKFKNNQIIDSITNKPIASDYELLKKMGK